MSLLGPRAEQGERVGRQAGECVARRIRIGAERPAAVEGNAIIDERAVGRSDRVTRESRAACCGSRAKARRFGLGPCWLSGSGSESRSSPRSSRLTVSVLAVDAMPLATT